MDGKDDVSANCSAAEVVIPHVLVVPTSAKRKRKDKFDEPLEDFVQRRRKRKKQSRDKGKYFQTIVTDYFRMTKVKTEKTDTAMAKEPQMSYKVISINLMKNPFCKMMTLRSLIAFHPLKTNQDVE